MSATAELTATEVATRLLPLMKEYAAKTANLSEQVAKVLEQITNTSGNYLAPLAVNAGRLIALHESLDKPVTDVAREASGLFEHAALEHYLREELGLRLAELQEHIRFSGVMIGELVKLLTARKLADTVRKLIEQSGHYKAPF